MSQVITKRFRVSRRRFLKGLTLAGGAVQVGLPPLVSMFNSTGTAYAAGRRRGQADREPLRLLVQRQRHSRALLDPERDRRGFSTSRRASIRWLRSATISTCSAAWTTRLPRRAAPATDITKPSAA